MKRRAVRKLTNLVALTLSGLRIWNAPRSATISCFTSPTVLAQRRANLKAPSLASAPELQKNTLSAKDRSTSAAARRGAGDVS